MLKLQAVELSKSYRGRKIVDDLELEIGQGEVVGFWDPTAQGRRQRFTSWWVWPGPIPAASC